MAGLTPFQQMMQQKYGTQPSGNPFAQAAQQAQAQGAGYSNNPFTAIYQGTHGGGGSAGTTASGGGGGSTARYATSSGGGGSNATLQYSNDSMIPVTYQGQTYYYDTNTGQFKDSAGNVVQGYGVQQLSSGAYLITGPGGDFYVDPQGNLISTSTGEIVGSTDVSYLQGNPYYSGGASGGGAQSGMIPVTYQGQTYYYDPNTNTFTDAQGNVVQGYSVTTNEQGAYVITGPGGDLLVDPQGNLINPQTGLIEGNVSADVLQANPYYEQVQQQYAGMIPVEYLGREYYYNQQTGTFVDAFGNPVEGYGVTQLPSGAFMITGPGGDFFVDASGNLISTATGAIEGHVDLSYLQGNPYYGGGGGGDQDGGDGGDGGGQSPIDELWNEIRGALDWQQGLWEQYLPQAQGYISQLSDMLSNLYNPQDYMDRYNQATQAAEQALAYAYRQRVPQLLDALAGRGVLQSSIGADAMAGLAGEYMNALANMYSQNLRTMPQQTAAAASMAQAAGQPARYATSLIGMLPAGGLESYAQLLGLLDMMGGIFV